MLPQEDCCVATSGSLCCHKWIVVLPQEDRCVATRGTFPETCFAHKSAHRIWLQTLSTDLPIRFSRRTQIRQPNTPKPIQQTSKTTKKHPDEAVPISAFALDDTVGEERPTIRGATQTELLRRIVLSLQEDRCVATIGALCCDKRNFF